MNLEQRIQSFIVENFLLGDSSGLTPTQSLLESGVVDSTGILELVTFLEEEFQIKVADREMLLENLGSIANILSFVQRKLNSCEEQTAG